MQKHHEIESHPDLFHKATIDDQTFDNRYDRWRAEITAKRKKSNQTEGKKDNPTTTSSESLDDSMIFHMDEKSEDEYQEKAKKILDTWRKTVRVKPEEKRENPKPEKIPIRRSKPKVLEETSPEKIREGEGSGYDPMIAFNNMD
jgi:hypothetical protein